MKFGQKEVIKKKLTPSPQLYEVIHYKGQTCSLEARLQRHNNGRGKSTKAGVPWQLVWSTQKETRSEALTLERKLKNLSRERTIQFIRKYGSEVASPDVINESG